MKENNKKFNYFNAIYIVLTIIFFIVAFINTAYFSYYLIDNLTFIIIQHIIMSLYLLTALIQNVLQTKVRTYKIMAYVTFIGLFVALNLRFLLPHDIWILVMFICTTMILTFVSVTLLIRKQKYFTIKLNRQIIITLLVALLISFLDALDYNYQNLLFMLWALLPTVIIFSVIITITFTVFKKQFNKLSPKKWQKFGFLTLVFVLSYCYSMFGVSIVNTSLPSSKTSNSYEIIEKDITAGARQITQYTLTVVIDEKEIDISVSNDVYYEKNIGDYIYIDYNQGALGFAYYEYSNLNNQ